MIYAPGSQSALPESPAMLEKSLKAAIVAEAKKIVDARLNAKNLWTMDAISRHPYEVAASSSRCFAVLPLRAQADRKNLNE